MDLAGNSHLVPVRGRPLRRLAHQLLTAACLSALFAPEALASDIPSQLGGGNAASSVSPAPEFAVIKANQQGYDQQLGRFVATGNVEARFNGWRLLADRIELAEPSRSVYASGQIRLIKGDQYLQASRLRYSDLEGSGELDDVYGVIDQDTLARDVNSQEENSQEPKAKTNSQSSDVSQPEFACPPLSAAPVNRRLLRVLPPSIRLRIWQAFWRPIWLAGSSNSPLLPTQACTCWQRPWSSVQPLP